MNPGTFKSKYVSYEITTSNKGYHVEHSYLDFLILRQEMIRQRPGTIVPSLPEIKLLKSIEQECTKKCKEQLQLFINDVLAIPILRNLRFFKYFISLEAKDWENMTKSLVKQPTPKHISQYITADGIAKVKYDDDLEKYCELLFNTTKNLKQLFDELNAVNKEISNILYGFTESLRKAGNIYDKIGLNYSYIKDKTHFELFTHMANGHHKLANEYNKIGRAHV